MSLKGWECKIKFPVKAITAERMIDVDGKEATGNGALTTFWSRSFPITDAAGNPTDVEADVTVYLDGVAQLSTAFTLTGAEGKIVFTAAPAAGKVTITYNFSRLVGYGQSASVKHSTSIDSIYEIGSRTPAELKEGNKEISLTLARCWLNRDHLGKVSGLTSLPVFDLDIMPSGIGTGKPYIRATGKFSGWSMDVGQDAIIMESVEFKGTVLTIGNQA